MTKPDIRFTPYTFKLPERLLEDVRRAALDEGMSASEWIRYQLRRALDESARKNSGKPLDK